MSGEQLERRYRGLLRILPKPYREAREEELLSALMDGAAEGRTRPEPGEVLSLARLGLRVRMRGAADSTPASPHVGATARAVAITGTMLLAFVGVTQMTIWAHSVLMWPSGRWSWSHPFMVTFPGSGPGVHEFSMVGYEVPTLWLVVLALLAVGWWRAARVLALAVFLVSAYLTDGSVMAAEEETLLAGAVTVAFFTARGVHARRVRVAGPVGVAAVLGMAWWTYARPIPHLLNALLALQAWGGTIGSHALVMTVAAVAVVCVVAYRSVVWSVGIAVVTVAALGPVLVRAWAHQDLLGSDLSSLAFLSCGLVVIACAAVVRARLSARGERPTPSL